MNNRVTGILLILLSITGSWAWLDYQSAIKNPVVSDLVTVEIEKGDSLDRIGEKLVAQDLAIKPFWFKVTAFLGKSYNKIKTGEYELKPGLTLPDILDVFVAGKTKQYAITFPEGWSLNEILQEVAKNPNLEHQLLKSDFINLMMQLGINQKNSNHCQTVPEDGFLFLPSPLDCPEGLPVAAVLPETLKSLEGLIFPDTYFFERHMSDISLLKRAYEKMLNIIRQEWARKSADLPFKTPYEALIMASIVEKETADKKERPLIAGVFIRRLQNDMLLQTDPTVIYGMGENFRGGIGYNDLKAETPYNTYVIKGLPPTPIAMPGLDAIIATLHPDKSNSLYFVSRGDGSHVFSATLKEHNLAVNKYQRKKK
ncbi:MAG: endolytic transglycosylase MltG [Methylococcaceae bacterium]|nr:endolytic transglycosylase MltG [Methylococcaceae bacterium]